MLHAGLTLDRYELVHALGRGGSAVVWAARHRSLGVRVAIKLIASPSPSLRERLLREGRAQAHLDHPNIVSVRDVLEDRGFLGLLMPLVEGPSLDRLLAVQRLTEAEALAIFRGVVSGVARAHERGFVHRDLKPGNILLDPQPDGLVPRVADFGLVKEEGRDGLTRDGAMMGTLEYAAPEQLLDAARADARADLFALGTIFVELLGAPRPFRGDSLGALLDAHRREPDLLALRPAHATLARELLARDPASRLPDAQTLLKRLAPLMPPDHASALHARSPLHTSARRIAADDRRATPLERPTYAPAELATPNAATPTPAPQRTHNLRPAVDAFIGRADEAGALEALLDEGATLVTALGTGGAGKTRFVGHFAWTRRDRWPGGAWWCDLTDARTTDDICAALARSLDVPLVRTGPVALLAHAIEARGECLIVLDNFEQVTRDAPETVGAWREVAPRARFLVTSRERLGLPGERVLPIEPMNGEDAIALFEHRMAGGVPERAPRPPDRATIAQLVDRLDRLPLAIELAAARTRVLSLESLLSRMDDRFRILSTEKGQSARHSTLRAALDWSWDLLDRRDRSALGQLSVFEGGFTVDAAEAVLDLPDEGWPIDAIQSLTDKSLVRRVSGERFDLLVSVQEYARAKREADDDATGAEVRHGRWFARFGALEALDALGGRDGVARTAALAADLSNLVAASRRAVACGDGEVAARTALAAWAVFEIQGPLSTGVALLEAALPVAGPSRLPVLIALGGALSAAGRRAHGAERLREALALAAGDPYAEALVRTHEAEVVRSTDETVDRDAVERAIVTFRELADTRREAMALTTFGRIRRPPTDLATCLAALERALTLFRELGDVRSEGTVLNAMAQLIGDHGRREEALGYFARARRIHREVGNLTALGVTLANLGMTHMLMGEPHQSIAVLEEALVLLRRTGRRSVAGFTEMRLGNAHRSLGDPEAARRHLLASLTIARETDGGRRVGFVLGNLADTELELGCVAEARAHVDEALALLRAARHAGGTAETYCVSALIHAREGAFEAAHADLAACRAVAPPDDRALQGQLLLVTAEVLRRAGDHDAAERQLDLVAETITAGGERTYLTAELAAARSALAAARAAVMAT